MGFKFTRQEYEAYMRSDLWAQKRQERLKLDKYKCKICGIDHDLQVHHQYDGTPYFGYPKKLGEETVDDLTTFCVWCHEEATNWIRRRRYDLTLKKLKPSQIESVTTVIYREEDNAEIKISTTVRMPDPAPQRTHGRSTESLSERLKENIVKAREDGRRF